MPAEPFLVPVFGATRSARAKPGTEAQGPGAVIQRGDEVPGGGESGVGGNMREEPTPVAWPPRTPLWRDLRSAFLGATLHRSFASRFRSSSFHFRVALRLIHQSLLTLSGWLPTSSSRRPRFAPRFTVPDLPGSGAP